MRGLALGAALGALCVACGDNAPPAPASTAATEFGESAANRAPVIESVQIDPSEPAQGAVVRAVVQARDPDGQGLVITHRWFVDGSERAGDATLALDSAG